MRIVETVNAVLHHIRVRLYPCPLPRSGGAYYARVSSEAMLTIDDIAAAMKSRAGFTGNYDDMVSYVNQFFDEMAYQLCDGFAVSTGYFSIHPAIGGYFNKTDELGDREKHPVSFRFRTQPPLRRLTRFIDLELDEWKDRGIIEQFIDADSGAVNKSLIPGSLFIITGYKIKVKGDNPDCGIYFVSDADPSRRFKVTRGLGGNTGRKISGLAPDLPPGEYSVEIKTQYTIGGTNLKEPRTIRSDFSVMVS